MVKQLKKWYDKLFKTREEIEHIKKMEFYNRHFSKTEPTIKDHKTNFKN